MDHSMLMNTTNKLVRHTIAGLLIATLCIAVNAAAANGKTLYA